MSVRLPEWLIPHLGVTVLALVGQTLVCSSTLAETSDNPFEAVGNVMTFQACTGNDNALPEWATWTFFFILTLPWLLLLTAYAFTAFNNAITGAILGGATLVTLLLLVGLSL